jgi:hypothetical protein
MKHHAPIDFATGLAWDAVRFSGLCLLAAVVLMCLYDRGWQAWLWQLFRRGKGGAGA